MSIDWKVPTCALALALGLGVYAVYGPDSAQAQTAPRYVFDPTWPKPLPNKW